MGQNTPSSSNNPEKVRLIWWQKKVKRLLEA